MRRFRSGRKRHLAPALRAMRWVALWAAVLADAASAQPAGAAMPFKVSGDAIEQSLTGVPGDPTRGRAIAVDRQLGLCLLCHTGPFPEERAQGSPAADRAGARGSCGCASSMRGA